MSKFIRNLIWQARKAILNNDRLMAVQCLDLADTRVTLLETTGNELIDERDEIIANLANDSEMWRARAIKQAWWRIGLAKAKKRLITINQNLKQRADKNFADWLEVCEDRALWETSHRRVVQDNDELITAIHRLPEPPLAYGDGPDERVGWTLEALENYRSRKPSYGKVVQDLTMLEMKNKELTDEIWCLRGEAGRVTLLDASFDIKQRLVVAEATLEAIRERAERIQEGEPWNLVNFVLKKISVKHASECWKNQSYLALGVGGDLVICTCGAERN